VPFSKTQEQNQETLRAIVAQIESLEDKIPDLNKQVKRTVHKEKAKTLKSIFTLRCAMESQVPFNHVMNCVEEQDVESVEDCRA